MESRLLIALAIALAFLVPRPAAAAEPVHTDAGTLDEKGVVKLFKGERPYSPYAGRTFPSRPLFGDTHVHTAASMDAGAFGCRLSPADAYRFAKGQEIEASSGQRAKLSRPLDFLVVSDHSDNMGFFPALFAGEPRMLADPKGREWYDLIQAGKSGQAGFAVVRSFSDGTFPKALRSDPGTPAYRSAWQETIKAAEEANDPGRFTAFIGYEWTSNTKGNNLHRNVLFRDDAAKASQVEPYTTLAPLGSDNPRDLWKWMSAYEEKTGGNVLAIAHNGNLSNGRMFPIIESFTGKKIDREYAEQRAEWERIYEVTQIKGDGEAHPFLSPNDEFANFETWDKANLDLTEVKKPEMLEFEYGRSALKNGLLMEKELGVNPFKIGFIGSSDAHTALAAVAEENFFGKIPGSEPNPGRAADPFFENKATGLTIMGWEETASGYAAVWATENTREAIFDAMERRETYATTGSRMIVRFFGGWDFETKDVQTREPAIAGYARGVPMGGDLPKAPKGKSPTFLVGALKDPIGANLDRIQIVKGWLDAEGKLHEKVHDVAWSQPEKRKPGADGKLPPVGDTVDVKTASWANTIGETELITVWKDPDFDPGQAAFYYARVLEIPTPRWTAYDAVRFGVEIPPDAPLRLQDRAYTSPIWYTPAK